jgi:hypothetical protein
MTLLYIKTNLWVARLKNIHTMRPPGTTGKEVVLLMYHSETYGPFDHSEVPTASTVA